ncbi:MAG: hypothetical protein Q8L34_05105 [Candidatus Woesearchaeota archaeon]|nr:hypothetical protein [Candidatus Woesearchaeota archaeon]
MTTKDIPTIKVTVNYNQDFQYRDFHTGDRLLTGDRTRPFISVQQRLGEILTDQQYAHLVCDGPTHNRSTSVFHFYGRELMTPPEKKVLEQCLANLQMLGKVDTHKVDGQVQRKGHAKPLERRLVEDQLENNQKPL